MVRRGKNSETASCSAAAFRCFVIQMLRIAKMALPLDPSLRQILDEIRMSGRYHKLTQLLINQCSKLSDGTLVRRRDPERLAPQGDKRTAGDTPCRATRL